LPLILPVSTTVHYMYDPPFRNYYTSPSFHSKAHIELFKLRKSIGCIRIFYRVHCRGTCAQYTCHYMVRCIIIIRLITLNLIIRYVYYIVSVFYGSYRYVPFVRMLIKCNNRYPQSGIFIIHIIMITLGNLVTKNKWLWSFRTALKDH
jgi:hypothetical protein